MMHREGPNSRTSLARVVFGRSLVMAAVALGLAGPFALGVPQSLAAGKTVKTKNLAAVPARLRPALSRTVRQLAARQGRRVPTANLPVTPEELNLACGDWLLWWVEDDKGNIEEGSVTVECDGQDIPLR
jgi:hypothetical protein